MKKLMNKLRARAGESFAEVLVALLIVALAALLLSGMYSASTTLDKAAFENDKKFYDAVTDLETDGASAATETRDVSITEEGETTPEVTIPVTTYTEDGLSAYKKR